MCGKQSTHVLILQIRWLPSSLAVSGFYFIKQTNLAEPKKLPEWTLLQISNPFSLHNPSAIVYFLKFALVMFYILPRVYRSYQWDSYCINSSYYHITHGTLHYLKCIGLIFENTLAWLQWEGKGLKSLGIAGSKQLVWASIKDYKDSKIHIFPLE